MPGGDARASTRRGRGRATRRRSSRRRERARRERRGRGRDRARHRAAGSTAGARRSRAPARRLAAREGVDRPTPRRASGAYPPTQPRRQPRVRILCTRSITEKRDCLRWAKHPSAPIKNAPQPSLVRLHRDPETKEEPSHARRRQFRPPWRLRLLRRFSHTPSARRLVRSVARVNAPSGRCRSRSPWAKTSRRRTWAPPRCAPRSRVPRSPRSNPRRAPARPPHRRPFLVTNRRANEFSPDPASPAPPRFARRPRRTSRSSRRRSPRPSTRPNGRSS